MNLLVCLGLARHILGRESRSNPQSLELSVAHEVICEFSACVGAMLAIREHLAHNLTGDSSDVSHVGVIGAAIGAALLPNPDYPAGLTGPIMAQGPFDLASIRKLNADWLFIQKTLGVPHGANESAPVEMQDEKGARQP